MRYGTSDAIITLLPTSANMLGSLPRKTLELYKMKNVISVLLGLLFFSPILYACDANFKLDIFVKNNTGVDCHLTQKNLNDSYNLKDHTKEVIKPGESSLQIRSSGLHSSILGAYLTPIDIELSYQCGDNKFITIESTCMFDTGSYHISSLIQGSTRALSNMDASFSKTRICEDETKASSINWVFH